MVIPCKWQFPSTCPNSTEEICGRQLFFNAFKSTGGCAEVKISRGKIDPRSMNLYVHWKTWNCSKCSCILNGHNTCTSSMYFLFKTAVPQVSESNLQFKHVGGSTEVNGPHSYKVLNQMYLVKQAAEWAEDMNNNWPFRGISVQQSDRAAAMAPGSTAMQTEIVNKKWTPNILVSIEQRSFRYPNRDVYFHCYYCISWY